MENITDGVRLNYATTHQHSPPPATTQNISTATYRHLVKAKIHLYITSLDIFLTASFSLKYNVPLRGRDSE